VIKDVILDKFGAGALKRSALNIRDGEGVFRDVLGRGRYRHVLEIGTYKGASAACMAQFCDRVTTIDLYHGRLEQLGEPWDRHQFWRGLGVGNIELRLVEDDAEKAAVVEALDFDFAFIDGAHDQRVRSDFELVKRCGTVLFHDYDRRGTKEKDQVADFIDTLPREQIEKIDIFALWTAPGPRHG
jgi:predicted O-methyltransferase YrrM